MFFTDLKLTGDSLQLFYPFYFIGVFLRLLADLLFTGDLLLFNGLFLTGDLLLFIGDLLLFTDFLFEGDKL
jgi:hypothetical protein